MFFVIAVLSFVAAAADTLDVYFLNVGHGDAILVKYRTTEWLIDVGYENQWLDISACEDFFPVPVDPPIEYFVLSHDDQDHYSALDKVLCSCGIERVFSSPDPDSIETLQDEIQEASDYHTNTTRPNEIEELSSDLATPLLGFELKWEVLHPTTDEAMDSCTKDNNKSLVLLLTFGNVSFLFPGDIKSLNSDTVAGWGVSGVLILKAPHHGRMNSTTLDLAEWLASDLVIVSTDDCVPETASEIARLGIPLFSTSTSGTIHLRTDGESVWLTTDTLSGQVVDCTDE